MGALNRSIKMKFFLIQLFLIFGTLTASAGNFFVAVEAREEGWEVVFPFRGIRYQIKIDDDVRGVSGYGQRLFLKNEEVLTLTEKHSTLEVTRRKEGPAGVIIVTTVRNPTTGKSETQTLFEPVHHNAVSMKQEIEEAGELHEKEEARFYQEAETAALDNEKFKELINSIDPGWAMTFGKDWGKKLSDLVLQLTDENAELVRELEELGQKASESEGAEQNEKR